MADLGEIFDGSVYMEIGGSYASAPADPIRKPLDGRTIFANMASRFAGAPAPPHVAMLDDSPPRRTLASLSSARSSSIARQSTWGRSRPSMSCACTSNGCAGRSSRAPARRSRPSRP